MICLILSLRSCVLGACGSDQWSGGHHLHSIKLTGQHNLSLPILTIFQETVRDTVQEKNLIQTLVSESGNLAVSDAPFLGAPVKQVEYSKTSFILH